MARLVALALLSFCLSSCIFGVFAAGAAAGGAVLYDKRTIPEQIHDKDLRQRIQVRITNDADLAQHSHISVAAFNRVVLLVGQAETEEYKNRAFQAAQAVAGSKRIYNEIVVTHSVSYVIRTDDDWITTKVRTTLLNTYNLRSSDIKVVTEDGIVYLMGTVTQRQAQMAADSARHVDGVRKVVTIFEYQP
ncbi:MAG TPA: BON domain-containing protein [Coxiellaceae bacterium]|nr:BON domain-containing protein [Coxiellaceae bacterium]